MLELRLLNIQAERLPLFCQWEITCRCNLRCVMCYTDCFNTPEKIRQELATHEILRIMDELAKAGCAELCLTGGEPLARPDFFQIYEYAKQKGFLVTVFTNGTLISEAMADRFAALPPLRIEISLHGITEKTFETITQGAGSFERCLKAIELLQEREIPLVLKATAMTLNKDELLKIKHYVENLGPGIRFKLGESLVPTNEGSLDPKRFELSLEELDEIEQEDNQLWKEVCAQEEKTTSCHSGEFTCHIDAYGQLQLCSGNRRKSYDLRKGSFQEGFYEFLPTFPCPLKVKQNVGERSCEHACR